MTEKDTPQVRGVKITEDDPEHDVILVDDDLIAGFAVAAIKLCCALLQEGPAAERDSGAPMPQEAKNGRGSGVQ